MDPTHLEAQLVLLDLCNYPQSIGHKLCISLVYLQACDFLILDQVEAGLEANSDEPFSDLFGSPLGNRLLVVPLQSEKVPAAGTDELDVNQSFNVQRLEGHLLLGEYFRTIA